MTRISNRKLDSNILEKLFILLFETIGKKSKINQFKETIFDLLSAKERIMIAKRVAIIYLLMKGKDYASICDVIKVSIGTVAKFSLIMDQSKGIVKSLNKIIKDEKISDFMEEILLTINRPGKHGIDWSSAWKHKNEFEIRKIRGI